MKALLITFFMCSAFAQDISDDPARPTLGKTGQIFTLKLIPQAKRLEVSFTEKPLVTLDPERLIVLGKVYSARGKPQTLNIRAVGQSLEIQEPIDPNAEVEFRVKDKLTKKTETIRVSPGKRP